MTNNLVELIFELTIKLLYLQLNKKPLDLVQQSSSELIADWQSPKSKLYIQNYHTLKPIFTVNKDLNSDFSHLAILLAKAYENELNLSYFNWIRKVNGISMPEYYDKYQKDKDEQEVDGLKLNKHENHELIYPPIGATNKFLDKLLKQNRIPEGHNIIIFERIIKITWKICALRNNAAHPEPLKKDKHDELESLFSEISNKYGKSIYDLKNLLKQESCSGEKY